MKISYFIKTIILRAKYGSKLRIKGIQHISFDTRIKILDGSIAIGKEMSTQTNVHITACNDGRVEIGDNVSFNRNDIIVSRSNIRIGNNIAFGPNVCLYDHDHVFDSRGFEKNKFTIGNIIIDDDCWIGAGVIILRNTHIGAGCIIGAGCVVKGNIPAHSIVTSDRELIIKPIHD